MRPEIIDALSLAGDRSKANDDTYGMAGNRLWVIDGATSLGSNLLSGSSDAAWLARTANRLFHTHHAVRDTHQLIRIVIEGLNSSFNAEQIAAPESRWHLPYGSFLMVTCHADSIEAVWLGDCRALLKIGDCLVTAGETAEGEARERAYAARLAETSGAAAMLRSTPVMTALRKSRDTYNTSGGTWVLGLQAEAADHLQTKVFPIADRVALPITGLAMTDGFSALELKYVRYDAAALLQRAQDEGLVALAAALRHIEEIEDPDVALFPRFKRSDDATAVLFQARQD